MVVLSIYYPPLAAEGAYYLLGQAMYAAGMMLAMQGIIEMMMPEMGETKENDNAVFKGPINNTKSGIPIPLCYGKMQVGGAPINFGFTQGRLRRSPGYDFVSNENNSLSYSSGTAGGQIGTNVIDINANVNWILQNVNNVGSQ